ncbi:MAG: phosphate acyltransferase PlsX [Planctomycetes bacterium]|nr:phosphate acyltransferase PlsX [Planctomycetota bacterium]
MGRVAVDAMGGDHAPREVVLGVLEAIQRDPGLEVLLVGQESRVREHLPAGEPPARVTLIHAADVVEMHESPVEALRRKPDNSIAKAIGLVTQKRADAFVSAGNTGGCVAAATFLVPRLPHCRRAGIAAPFPTRTGHCVVMDVGANIQCKPIHLVQYAVMAAAYAKDVIGIANPRVAVLSVGGEEGKGSPLVKDVFAALKVHKGVNFIGNVEGQHVFSGDAEVIVCEGFTGNVILKAAEGMSEAFLHILLAELRDALGGENPAVQKVITDLRRKTDYEAYGGAPLLGHEGGVFISHGRSKARAIKNAVLAAGSYVDHQVNIHITEALAALSADTEVSAIVGNSQ